MLIESLAQKTGLAMITVVTTIAGYAVIYGFTVWCCIPLVSEERQQIHIPDGDTPFLAERAQLEANFTMEAKAHIQLLHQYFLNPPPDNDYIKRTFGRAMYMANGTTLKRKQTLDENDSYSDVILSSTVCTIMCDSILLNEHERKFIYYDTQLIKRRTKNLKRSMVTTGYIGNMPGARNNPHRLMITNWRTIENEDLDY